MRLPRRCVYGCGASVGTANWSVRDASGKVRMQERRGLPDGASRRCRRHRQAMKSLKQFLGNALDSDALVFRSKRGGPLLETTILSQCLHPALGALGLPRSGFHAFRRGCNRRWELAGLNPAVHRQMMGHSSETMTRLYSGDIPLQDVASAFSKTFGNQIDVLETMETEAAA
jgi:integrase